MTTGEGGSPEDSIKLGEPIQRPTKWQKIKDWVGAKKVAKEMKMGEAYDVPTQSTNEALVSGIKVGMEVAPDVSVLEAVKLGQPEVAVNMYVSAALNQRGANIFAQNLRGATASMVTHPQESYEPPAYYSNEELIELADRWNLPLLVFRKNANHWLLALKPPEEYSGGYRVLVYDPFQNQEVWFSLNNRIDNSASPFDLMKNFGYANRQGLEELKDGSYNLSLIDDIELADNSEVMSAKQTRLQFNEYDCGPLCLFAAALREGVKKDWNAFKFGGKEQLQRDTEVTILTREQILETKHK